ncbi:unnamed protein product, partial [Durusdinium trenchii]
QAGPWQIRDALNGWRECGEVKVLQGPLSFPPVLYLVTEQRDSVYELMKSEFLNGQPLWRCNDRGTETWLYSTSDGFWCLSQKDRLFSPDGYRQKDPDGVSLLASWEPQLAQPTRQPCAVPLGHRGLKEFPSLFGCSLGTLASSQPHGGSMPHFCEEWQVQCSRGWEPSSALLQTNPPESLPVLHVEAVDGIVLGHEHLLGTYWKEGELLHHRPVWRPSGSKDGPLLFSTRDGHWLLEVHETDEATSGFRCERASSLRVTALKRGVMLGVYESVPGATGTWRLSRPKET